MHTFNWIKEFLKSKDRATSISDVLPDVFTNYLLVPWCVGIIDDFPFSEYPEYNVSIEDLNNQHSIKRKFGIFLVEDIEHNYRKVTLKEIADKFQVSYCPDSDLLVKQTPGVCNLKRSTKQMVERLVNALPRTSELNLFVEDNTRFAMAFEDWNYKEENVIFNPSEYIAFQEKTSWDSTSYLFPTSLQWCLCTVEDVRHFILGCERSIGDLLHEMPELEVFEITSDYAL